jgi:A/G-specific adenine glycosylase
MDELPGRSPGQVAAGDGELLTGTPPAASTIVTVVAHVRGSIAETLDYTAVGLTPRDRSVQVSRAEKATGNRRPRRSATGGSVANPAGVRRRLAGWYARAKRDLPWRQTRDPYAIWVSEVMLQQTQVERVKEFFARFMRRFPRIGDLAAAPEADVLKHWEGLGYYRRARQLHAAAKAVIAEHGGEFPASLPALRSLPGVGRYTAGAIASIAFDLPAAIVEANSRRVLARLAGHAAPVGGAGDEPIWAIAERLVPRRAAGGFNQALMDLGAMICTPTRPLCGRCPLAVDCAAHATGREDAIPVMTAPRATKEIHETAVVTRRGDRVLVVRRGPGEWWEGLWDFPREPRGAPGRAIGHVRYGVTHHRIECRVVERRVTRSGRVPPGGRWVPVADLDGLAMTAPGRRIATLVAGGRAAPGARGSRGRAAAKTPRRGDRRDLTP